MRLDFEQWRELASPFYEVYPHEPVERAGVDIEITEIDGLFVADVTTPAELLVHEPANRKDASHDYLLFERFFSGSGHCEVADTGFNVSPSQSHLIDMSHRYVSMKARSRSRGVCIPHAALGFVPGEEPAFTALALDSPKGRLLAAAHAELIATRSDATGEDTAVIARTFVDLVRQLMLGHEPRCNMPKDEDLPLTLLLRDYIATNLYRPDLDAEMLTSAFGISRATLYRHFEQEGGVARHIRDRRLDRCFFELSRALPGRGKVGTIARRWHFTDATHFNRIFRERFGMAPSQCLSVESQPGSGAPSDQVRIVKDWLERFRRN